MPGSTPFAQRLRTRIRHGLEPDNPALVMMWLDFEDNQCAGSPCDQQWRCYRDAVDLLLETFTDELNPSHWRVFCLDQLVRPLCCLQRLAGSDERHEELQGLLQEISTLSHFFCPSLSRPD
ncbi:MULTISPECIES: hypothetical protein [Marinobacter]|uniref:hypothetical protein n=1 Tax=Marinobacter TaxID=2742 RepID=UPI0013A6D4F9|nr:MULTISPECIES: hypothetical protein [Marinobacter]